MIEYLNEYDFYMEWEHKFLGSTGCVGIVAFTSNTSRTCILMTSKLEELSETIDIPMVILDIEDCEHLVEDLHIYSAPCVLVYSGGEIIMRFNDDMDVFDMAHDVVEFCNELKSTDGGLNDGT